jgi:hypothetical protein
MKIYGNFVPRLHRIPDFPSSLRGEKPASEAKKSGHESIPCRPLIMGCRERGWSLVECHVIVELEL